jgi:hypothetical protein
MGCSMRAFPIRSWAAVWLVCQMLASLAPILGSCCPDPGRAPRHDAHAGQNQAAEPACPMHRASAEAQRVEEGAACPMHRQHHGPGACCRLMDGAGCEPHTMAVVVPAVLTSTPVLAPLFSASTPVSVASDREARLGFTPDLPPPRA